MGIKPEWIAKFRKLFPEAFLHEPRSGESIEVIVDDWSLALRGLLSGCNTGEELGKKCIRRIIDYTRSEIEGHQGKGIETYVICMDEKAPRNKSIVQEKRVDDKIGQGRPPFSKEEILEGQLHVDGEGLPPVDRLAETSVLREDIFRFVTDYVVKGLNGNANRGPPMVIIDGARCVSDLTGKSHPHPTFPHLSRTYSRVVTVQRRLKDSRSDFMPVTEAPSTGIGESDLKISHYVMKNRGKTIMVRPYDSDFIVILLLVMRDLINCETGLIDTSVYVDTRTRAGKKNGENGSEENETQPPFVHIPTLWRCIWAYFEEKFPKVMYPIETLCTLVLMNGSDYADSVFGIGPKGIWDFFEEKGHAVIAGAYSRDSQLVLLEGIEMHDSMGAPIGPRFDIGKPGSPHRITIAHDVFLAFFAELFWDKHKMADRSIPCVPKAGFYSTSERANRAVTMLVRCGIDHREKIAKERQKKETYKPGYEIPPAQQLVAMARRIRWNLHYWINGGKPDITLDLRYYDPFLQTNGVSENGWAIEEETVEVEGSDPVIVQKVKRAKSVRAEWLIPR